MRPTKEGFMSQCAGTPADSRSSPAGAASGGPEVRCSVGAPRSASDADPSQIDELLALTPAERLLRHESALELAEELRKAGSQLYGFDPRAAVAAARPGS